MYQVLNKDATKLYYMERIVFRKDININNIWTLNLGNSGESTLSYVIVGFHARDKIDLQTHDNAIFIRLPISNAFCIVALEKYLVDGIECDYDRDN